MQQGKRNWNINRFQERKKGTAHQNDQIDDGKDHETIWRAFVNPRQVSTDGL